MMRGFGAWMLCALALTLSGCDKFGQNAPGKSPFASVDITGSSVGGGFQLVDHTGQARTLGDYAGKWVVMFFGFTHCPDVCPTTMAKMADVMKQLGPDATRVQVLFISLDPKRDTQAVLAQYVPAFHPSFVGLTGDEQAVAAAAKAYKIYYREAPGKTPETYTIDHSAGAFVLDRAGKPRLFVADNLPAETIAKDLKTLMERG